MKREMTWPVSMGQRAEWVIWLSWLAATTLSYLLLFGIIANFHHAMRLLGTLGVPYFDLYWSYVPRGLLYLIPPVCTGAIVGAVPQGLILRRYLPSINWRQWMGAWVLGWLTALPVGWVLFATLYTGIRYRTPDASTSVSFACLLFAFLAATGVVAGAILAGPQWLTLRHHLPHAEWWVGANAAAGALVGIELGILNFPALSVDPSLFASELVSGLIVGLIMGAVTGAVLIRLLRQHQPMDTNIHKYP